MGKIKEKQVTLFNQKKITIRSSTPEDAENLITYQHNIFATSEYVVTTLEEFNVDLTTQKKRTQDILAKPGSISIVALNKGVIVGHLNFTGNQKKRTQHRGMFGIGIIDSWRGQGVGKALVQTLIEWAQQEDNHIEKIELLVMAKNIPALNLYLGLGFKEEGRIINEIKLSDSEYIDGIMMGLPLNQEDSYSLENLT